MAQARTRYFTAKTTDEKVAAAEELDRAFLQVNALSITENYPNVQFAKAFTEFRDIYAGSENRIRIERNRYNGAVKDYNIAIKTVPGNVLAPLFGFGPRKLFEAAKGSEDAPTLDFG